MGARVIDDRGGPAAGLKEGLAAEVAGLRGTGVLLIQHLLGLRGGKGSSDD